MEAAAEELIHQTSQKLKALGDLESVREKPLAIGVGIEYPETPMTDSSGPMVD